MSTVEGILNKIPGLEASADLSALQFRAVIPSGDFTVNVAGAAASAIGILQNKPISGAAAQVAATGSMSKAEAGAAFAVNVDLMTDSVGRLVG